MTLKEMQEHYPTQESCIELLEDLIWSFEPTCPHCQSKDLDGVMQGHYNSKDAYLCRDCKQFYSVTTNTMFQHSKVPLVKWFLLIHLIKTHELIVDVSQRQLSKMLGVSRNSCRKLIRKILVDIRTGNDCLSNRIHRYNRLHDPNWF